MGIVVTNGQLLFNHAISLLDWPVYLGNYLVEIDLETNAFQPLQGCR
jgi:hypothetical protein